MMYAVRVNWKLKKYGCDGYICDSAKDRDDCISDIIESARELKMQIENVYYCRIYKSGEYGKRTFVEV